jgi:hypothetical protein
VEFNPRGERGLVEGFADRPGDLDEFRHIRSSPKLPG